MAMAFDEYEVTPSSLDFAQQFMTGKLADLPGNPHRRDYSEWLDGTLKSIGGLASTVVQIDPERRDDVLAQLQHHADRIEGRSLVASSAVLRIAANIEAWQPGPEA